MISLDRKVAVITGGASGIGEAVVRTIARLGGSLIIADIDEERAKQLAAEVCDSGGKATAVATNIMVEDEIRHMIDAAEEIYGGIDILHNNAGVPRTIAPDCEISELSAEWWHRTIVAHLTSAMLGCKYAIPKMVKRGGGAIVNTSSLAGACATVGMPSYGVAKAGVNQLTREIAATYGRENVRCNAVAPGPVITERMKATLSPEMFASYAAETSLPRISTPQDLANIIVFLCSEQARMITGQIINVDGGLSGKLPGWSHLMESRKGSEFAASACTYEQAVNPAST